jgi:hypothetical protein
MLLMALPTDMQIEITALVAATSDRPMDDLRSLGATYSSMRRICGNPVVGRRALHPGPSQ